MEQRFFELQGFYLTKRICAGNGMPGKRSSSGPPPMVLHFRVLTALLWTALLVIPVGPLAQQNEDSALLKAAFVFNFAKFTTWPEHTWSSPEVPITLCVLGADELFESLKRLAGKTVKQRRMVVVALADSQTQESCDLLYVSHSGQAAAPGYLQSLREKPVLTVGQAPLFVEQGGIIRIYQETGRIRFAINLSASRRAGLSISSRLLRLADIHEESPGS